MSRKFIVKRRKRYRDNWERGGERKQNTELINCETLKKYRRNLTRDARESRKEFTVNAHKMSK
jgi:hypothetical protein